MTTLLERLSLGWKPQVPMVLQTEASECGLASLTMVAHYFGYRADLPHLRRRFGMSLKGATLKDVMRVADQIGLASRPLRLELSELTQLRLPCILHWDLNHFVVLNSVGARGPLPYCHFERSRAIFSSPPLLRRVALRREKSLFSRCPVTWRAQSLRSQLPYSSCRRTQKGPRPPSSRPLGAKSRK